MRTYKITEGSLQDKFHASRAKVQMFGGGFANGKTAAVCIKALRIAQDYPGSNGLLARSTYPKLNDTLRKEFFKWCPKAWIKVFTKTDNTVELKNGSTINFRYVSQNTKDEGSTSNLLSATYDYIIVDQIEDPEIVHKDFLDLLGRLRGSARYIGDDPSMPTSGPRWLIITCNPTSGWVYRKLVKPLLTFQRTGIRADDLLVDTETHEPIIELFEGSTYTNSDNLEGDFIRTLEATYSGQMRDRFLLGKWSSYEGLVYPQFDPEVHELPHMQMVRYLERLRRLYFKPTIIEGYDHGLAAQSCYILGFADDDYNVFLVDGFYERNQSIEVSSEKIKNIRKLYGVEDGHIYADPSIFRRTPGDSRVVGRTVASLYHEHGISMQRGNNDILNGIIKVQSYLIPQMFHRHPIFGQGGAPKLFVSTQLEFVSTEFAEYRWKKDGSGEEQDKPVDGRDHALDTIKYMLSDVPSLAIATKDEKEVPEWMYWQEAREMQDKRARHRV